jgi:hypothetical protein
VVLDFADNRALTDLFKDQVQRELTDNLRAAFGKLANVTVVRKHDALKEIEAKGLQQALDGPAWKNVSDKKTHFVRIDFVNGKYEIQARQHDGMTGQSGPIVRKASTRERPFVARTIGLLIDRDFGIVGAVPDKEEGGRLEVKLIGKEADVALDRWVQKGDVFALVQIVRSGGRERAVRVPWALLQAQEPPREGVVTCRLYHRHKTPLDQTPGFVAFRCIKLATIKAPLRVRFVKAGAKLPTVENGLFLHIRRHGFDGEDEAKEEGAIDSDGFFQSRGNKPYDGIAFVSVFKPDTDLGARIPVALVDERTIIVAINLKAEASAPLRRRLNQWVQHVYDGLQTNRILFKELNELAVKEGQRAAAVDKAKDALKNLKNDLANREKEIDVLKKVAADAKVDFTGPMKQQEAEGKQRLMLLQADSNELEKFIDGQSKVLADQNNPAKQKLYGLVEQARGLEAEAEFPKALALYEKAIDDGIKEPAVIKRRDELKKRLTPTSLAHAKAQKYVYDTWPRFDAAKMKEQVDEAQQAFAACRDAKDTLTPRKLLKVAIGHVAKLKQQIDVLKPDEREEDQKPAEELAAVLKALSQLIGDVSKFLEENADAK